MDVGCNGINYTPISYEQVKEIRIKYIPRIYSMYKLADEYKTSRRTIWEIIKGRIRTDI